jgi:hypothetical protein
VIETPDVYIADYFARNCGDDRYCIESLTANAIVATVLGSIPGSVLRHSGTDETVLNKVMKKSKNPPLRYSIILQVLTKQYRSFVVFAFYEMVELSLYVSLKCTPMEKDQERERQVVALSVLVGAGEWRGF